jgi:hypothetical protein
MKQHTRSVFTDCSNNADIKAKDLFERVLRLEIASLQPEDDVEPHLPLLCRLALAHEARPREIGQFSSLANVLQTFPEADKCREYASADWEAVLRPIQKELESLADGFATPAPGIASSLGESLTAEFERVDAQSRMTLLVSELARIMREAITSQDAYSELLSSPGLQMEVCLMLPLSYSRVSRYFKLGTLLAGLSRIDHSYVLLKSLLCNVPGLMNKVIPIIVSAAQRAAEDARELARSIAGAHATTDRDAQTWWSGALIMMGSLSSIAAYRIRSELVAAAILPHIVVQLTVDKIRDPLVFFLGTIIGHEWLWEYIHATLQDQSSLGSNSPIQRLRADMSLELERQTKSRDAVQSNTEQDAAMMQADDDAETSNLGLDLLALLRLYSVMVAYGGMQLTLPELMGDTAASVKAPSNAAHTGVDAAGSINATPRSGLLGILSGAVVPACKSSRSYAQQARQLALCVLVLWPRLKIAVAPQFVISAVKSMWADGHSWEGRHSQLILQFATYLVTREFASVGGWVRSATGLNSNIQGDSLTKLADMVMEGTDIRHLSRAIMGMPHGHGADSARARAHDDDHNSDPAAVEKHARANAYANPSTALHCVQALLRSDKFLQSSSDSEVFSQWLIGQMSRARAPLDPLLPTLVEDAAKRSLTEGSVAVSLPVSDLKMLIQDGSKGGAAGALLAAYYLLCRKSALARKRMDDHFVQRRRHAKRGSEVRACGSALGHVVFGVILSCCMLVKFCFLCEWIRRLNIRARCEFDGFSMCVCVCMYM